MPIMRVFDVEFELHCTCGKKLECEVQPSDARRLGYGISHWDEHRQITVHRCPDCLKKARTEAAKIGYIAGHDDTVESRYADPDETAEDICQEMEVTP